VEERARRRSANPPGRTSKDNDWDKVPTPKPLEPRDKALLRTIEIYLTFAPPPDEAATVKFLRATVLWRRDRIDEALPIFIDIVDHHRDHEVAESAANLVLDSYNLLRRYDQLNAFAEKIRADKKFS
jgi:hypothetical protein